MNKARLWESVEYRPGDDAGVRLRATEAGIVADWGQRCRTFNPTEARKLASLLMLGASEAEKRGAKDWKME